jgi:tetratricopeptide (TPR) repeat protein
VARKLALESQGNVHEYCRADVLRILRITQRQMTRWEKAGLLPLTETYSFFDLLQIKKLHDLSAKRVSSAVIQKSLEQMRIAVGMENPLLESSVFSTGRNLAFRHQGRAVEPLAGQFVMDFEERKVLAGPGVLKAMPEPDTVPEMFARAVALEDDPATQQEAVALYLKVIETEPNHAAAHINLGTICYNRHDYTKAEKFYRLAVQADSRYALAYFDLANVLDETGRLEEAVSCYKNAITIAPTYADAHYNLALAYEKLKQPRKALQHWRQYVMLDKAGPWSSHARAQMKKILKQETLTLVPRS